MIVIFYAILAAALLLVIIGPLFYLAAHTPAKPGNVLAALAWLVFCVAIVVQLAFRRKG